MVDPKTHQEQGENKPARDEKGRLLPGNTANPGGRPKGRKSIKERLWEYLEQHPEEMDKFVEHFAKGNRELGWQMLEGRPFQDIVSGGERIPMPIIPVNVPVHDSDKEGASPEKED